MKHQVFLLILKSHPRNQGFSIVFALAIGLVMSLLATAMLLQSSFYARQVVVEQQIEQNKSNAQNGLTQLLALLNRGNNRILASTNSENWGSALRAPELYPEFIKYLQVCDAGPPWEDRKKEILNFADNTFIKLPSGDFQLQSFEVLDENRAKAVIKGSYQGASTLAVELGVRQNHYFEGYAPTVWLKGQSESTGRNSVEGQFWANNCRFNLSNVRAIGNLKKEYTAINFPSLPDLNEVINRLPEKHKNLALTSTTNPTELKFPRTGDQPTLIRNGV